MLFSEAKEVLANLENRWFVRWSDVDAVRRVLAEVNFVKSKLTNSETEYHKLHKQLTRAQAERDEAVKQIETGKAAVGKLQECVSKHNEVLARARKAEDELAKLKTEVFNNQKRLEVEASYSDKLREQMETVLAERNRLQEDNQYLKDSQGQDGAYISNLQREVETLKSQLTVHKVEIDRQNGERAKLEGELQNVAERTVKAEGQLSELKIDVAVAVGHLQNLLDKQ